MDIYMVEKENTEDESLALEEGGKINMKNIKMGLIRGRHEMPVDLYILEKDVADPTDIMAIEQAVAERLGEVFEPYMGFGTVNVPSAIEYVDVPVRKCVGARLDLYVTGLTAVTLAAVNYCHIHQIPVTAWHYNRATGEYVKQKIS